MPELLDNVAGNDAVADDATADDFAGAFVLGYNNVCFVGVKVDTGVVFERCTADFPQEGVKGTAPVKGLWLRPS